MYFCVPLARTRGTYILNTKTVASVVLLHFIYLFILVIIDEQE